MKYTLLELVQNILSSMDSDEVNSISDSVESLQVANIVRTAYFDIINRANLPEHYSIVTLDSSLTSTKPVLMYVPNTVREILWVKYDKREDNADPINMEPVEFLSLEDFINNMHMLNTSDTDVASFSHTVGPDTFTFLYKTNEHPTYYTTFDDNTVIFNSYYSDIDTTLQKSKTMCLGRLVIPFTMSDSFIPDLDEEQFNLLLNEAKSLAWFEIKQSGHTLAERNSRRAWTHTQKKKNSTEKVSDLDRLPNFGRK